MVGSRYSSQDFEQSAFPSAIEANYAHNFAMSDFKTDILERPKNVGSRVARCAAVAAKGRKRTCRSKRFSQRSILSSFVVRRLDTALLDAPNIEIAVSLIVRIWSGRES